ncbi:MAG: tetratricopeptide repeat protein [Candidatus Cyclonatronum sp.]|uniref:tetratricopeptide repeat protein n=1 Tax=Cyclonatronum sp. TaxID=3024185 RepID=UPI0025B97486|nr:tetratricopeptide repeat protein [Cyclonatronum sp.]MCH8485639.1 tetratricopeptide repeat protein [Cyclonatronum sp.]
MKNLRLLITLTAIAVLCPVAAAQQYVQTLPNPADASEASIRNLSDAVRDAAGNYYLLDSRNGTVIMLNSAGELIEVVNAFVGPAGTVQLRGPVRIEAGPDNRLYIADDRNNEIYVLENLQYIHKAGESGRMPGQFSRISDIAVDADNYLYVLDERAGRVDIFDYKGRFINWIGGPERGQPRLFENVAGLGINGANQLYVLESNPARLHIFSDSGQHLRSFNELGSAGSQLQNAGSLTVFRNGHFSILDKDSGTFSTFNSDGEFLQRTGRSARASSPGIFRDPSLLRTTGVNPNSLLVIDSGASNIQEYVYAFPAADFSRTEKIQLELVSTSLPRFHDAVFAPNGVMYFIPDGDQSIVVALDLDSGEQLFRLPAQRAHRLATDSQSRVYVLDQHRRSNEINVFNSQGVLELSLGRDIPNPLQSPEALAVKSDGTIIVADASHDRLHSWARNGEYLGDTISLRQFNYRSISFIRTDSRDNIYLLDSSDNEIYRLNAAGMLTDPQPLTVKGYNPARGNAGIVWFDIDQSDQLHLFNSETLQYYLFEWEPSIQVINAPKLLFKFGREGSDELSFSRTGSVALNPYQLTAHISNDRGRQIKSIGITIRPPKPDLELFAFSVDGEGFLHISPKAGFDGVTSSFSLAVENPETGAVEIISSDNQTIQVRYDGQRNQLLNYRILGASAGNLSEPSEPFSDYIGYGRYLASQELFVHALEQYSRAPAYYLNPQPELVNHIAREYIRWGQTLTNRGEAYLTTLILRNAAALLDDRDPLTRNISEVLITLYNTLGRRGAYDVLIESTDNLTGITSPSVVDEVSRTIGQVAGNMARTGVEQRILQSIDLYNRMLDWAERPEWALTGMAAAQLAYYELLERTNAPYHLTSLRLNRAQAAIDEALDKIRLVNDLYNESRILQIRILNNQGRYEQAIEITEQELTDQIPGLDRRFERDYRYHGGAAMIAAGEYNRAVFNFTELLQLDQNNAQVQLMLANAFYSDQRYAEAQGIYRELLLRNPDEAIYQGLLGRTELALGNYAEASFQLEQAIRINPAVNWFYGELARAFYMDGKYTEALGYFELSVAETQARLAAARQRQLPQPAQTEIRAELETYLFEQGLAATRIRNYDTATQALRSLVELTPSNAKYWFELGNVYVNTGLVYQAENAFSRALSIDSQNETYRNAFNQARQNSDEYATNQPPARILSVQVNPVFPSVYRNYTEAQSIGQLVIENNTASVITNARLEVSFSRFAAESYFIDLPVMSPRSNTTVPLFMAFTSDIMSNDSDTNAQLTLNLIYNHRGEALTDVSNANVTIHRRSAISWRDKRSLAAFISPGSETIRQFVSEINSNLEPFSDRNLPEAIAIGARLYSTLNNSGFVYQRDPNIETILTSGVLDDIQFPAETLTLRSGECDDFVVLFCSLFEAQGIRTAYIDVPGHVFMAFDTGLTPDDLNFMGLDANRFITYENRLFLPIETTLLGRGSFMQAWENAALRWQQEREAGNMPQIVPIDQAHRVYAPSEFVPADFRSPLVFSDNLIADYNFTLQQVFNNFNAGMIQSIEQRLIAEPENLFLVNQLGVLLAKTGDTEKAREVFERGLEIFPASPQINNNLGNLYFEARNFIKAAEHYRKSAEANSNNANVYVNLARALLQAGQTEPSRDAMRQALRIDQDVRTRYDFIFNELF